MKVKIFITVSLLSFQALIAEPTEQDHIRASHNPGYYKHVVLKGNVKRMIFPGPPHFLSVENGDWAEPRTILEVDEASLERLVEAQSQDLSRMGYLLFFRINLYRFFCNFNR